MDDGSTHGTDCSLCLSTCLGTRKAAVYCAELRGSTAQGGSDADETFPG